MKKHKAGVTNVYERNKAATKPIVANVGGADSSKSHSIAQIFIEKFFNERAKTFLVCRKTLPALKLTAYRLIITLLKEYGSYSRLKHNKSEHTLTATEFNNLMVFASIDDPEKFKSMEFNYIWMEEANEFTWYDFITLKKCLRAMTRDGNPNRLYLTFNPADEQGWIKQRLFEEPDVERIHSTYKDNPFAQEADIAVLEGLRDQDESYWQTYAKGLFAKIEGMIHDLHIIAALPESHETIYGLDFGFVHPNALLEIGINMEHMALYITELLYETGMTNAELKEKMKDIIPEEHRGREIYADSAEPARIEEIYQEGFNIQSADKEKKSVINGIDCVNRFKLFSTMESVNSNREIRGYKRKVDRAGRVLEEPIKFRDHCPNALRYAAYTHLRDRLVGFEPEWTIHAGMAAKQAEEEKIESPREKDAPESPVTNELKLPKGKARGEPQGKEEAREDESWVV